MDDTGSTGSEAPARSRGGRPRDDSRDAVILDATLAVLAETGYEKLTMDEVARRAGAGKATLYRRWPSKPDLVVAAVGRVGGEPSLADLPDTGTLRGDLRALIRPQTEAESAQVLALVGGLASLLSADPVLADAASTALVAPFVASQRLLLERARDRGEIGPDVDVETFAMVTPSMTAYRLIVLRRPVDAEAVWHLIDTVVLPALGPDL